MRRNRDAQPKHKIRFVYYDQIWRPDGNEPIEKLKDRGLLVRLTDWDISKDKHCFCPRCGWPCYRSPKYLPFGRSERYTFGHYRPGKGKEPPSCNLRTGQREGKRYTTEVEKSRAVEDGRLTIIRKWAQIPSDDEHDGIEPSIYQGTVEAEQGPLATRPIVRHVGPAEFKTSEVTSLQFVAEHIDKFLGQDIQLPDFEEPEPFLDVFIHASQAAMENRQTPALYWGRAQKVYEINNYICVGFGYKDHCVFFGIRKEVAANRGWTVDNLIGRNIVIAGLLMKAPKIQKVENQRSNPRECWQIVPGKADSWGAVGVISEQFDSILPPNLSEWVEPATLETVASNQKDIIQSIAAVPLIRYEEIDEVEQDAPNITTPTESILLIQESDFLNVPEAPHDLVLQTQKNIPYNDELYEETEVKNDNRVEIPTPENVVPLKQNQEGKTPRNSILEGFLDVGRSIFKWFKRTG
jgi:hypothetical protein